MRRMIVYLGILAAVLWAGDPGTDIGMLIPVETVFIQKQGDEIAIQTDSADTGVGATMKRAAEDLKEKADGVIYLDTADYLILNREAEALLPQLQNNQKQEVFLCEADGQIDVQKATAFLRAHTPQLKLSDWSNGMTLPRLEEAGGSFKIKTEMVKKGVDKREEGW